MNDFSKERRAFAAALGGLLAIPSLIGLAGGRGQQADRASGQSVGAALQVTGETLTDPQIERTRRALDMLGRDLDTVRKFAVPPGVEPAAHFRAR